MKGGRSFAGARCLVTDVIRSHTEVPLLRASDGAVLIKMMPLSFALVEW